MQVRAFERYIPLIHICFHEQTKGAFALSDHVFMWHVIQGGSESLIMTFYFVMYGFICSLH